MRNKPTVFHITHQKAGSQWVREVLKHCALERFVMPRVQAAQFFEDPIKPGGIYPAVYVSKECFKAVMSPTANFDKKSFARLRQHPVAFALNWLNFQVLHKPYLYFVIIRDLRDTLVSLYFSWKVSHPLLTKDHHRWREILNSVDKEKGIIYLMDEVLARISDIQLSWLDDNAPFIKYEQLLINEHTVFEQIIDYSQLEVSRQHLREIVKYNSFEVITGGRKRGQEVVTAHQRKGIAGDWRNHFSDRVKTEFKKRFGETLIKTGYELDFNW